MPLRATPNRGLWNTSALHNCLASLFWPRWRLFHHLFIQQTLMHPQKGQRGKKSTNRSLPGQGLADKSVETEVQLTMVYRFSGWDGGCGLRLCLSLLRHLRMSFTVTDLMPQGTEWHALGRVPRLKNSWTSVQTPAAAISTDSWPPLQVNHAEAPETRVLWFLSPDVFGELFS